jgi:hypothetical protein
MIDSIKQRSQQLYVFARPPLQNGAQYLFR